MPQAFGHFNNSFVLNCVCSSCNSYFSSALELVLGRDSMEALLRLKYGVKPATEAREFVSSRVVLSVNASGPWFGAKFSLKPDATGKDIEPELLSQVCFQKELEQTGTWFTEDQLDDPSILAPYIDDKRITVRVVGPTHDSMLRVEKKLIDGGIDFHEKGSIAQPTTKDGTFEALVVYQPDEIILRCISKIAFNYAAYTKGVPFMLRSDFDEIRKFIRYGINPKIKPVAINTKPVLFDDSTNLRQTNGHLVTLDWNSTNKGLLVQVSLFNSLKHTVLLCPDYSGIWYDLREGHHFDVENCEISKLTSVRLVRA